MRPRLRRSDGALREGEVERWFRKEERLGGGRVDYAWVELDGIGPGIGIGGRCL